MCVCLLAFLVRDICSSSAPSLLRWRRGGIRPASGGSGGIGPASGGSGGKGLASGGVPAMYCWSFTKGEAGARVEMKGHLSSDLVAHDGVKRFTDMQLGFQLQMLLVREMPTDPSGHWDQIRWPLAAWRTEQSSSRTFSIAIEENTGSSKALTTFTGKPGKRGGRKVGPLPKEKLNPQFNGSFVRVSGEMAMQGPLAAGSVGRRGELETRSADVFGLADLFMKFGLQAVQGRGDEAVERAASLGT